MHTISAPFQLHVNSMVVGSIILKNAVNIIDLCEEEEHKKFVEVSLFFG
jgi:hypothetical protein